MGERFSRTLAERIASSQAETLTPITLKWFEKNPKYAFLNEYSRDKEKIYTI
jgi:hypothetical protein